MVSYVTSNYFFHEFVSIQIRLSQMSNGSDQELKWMAEGMKMKLEKYWENYGNLNLLLYVAVVLDARFKLKYVKFWLERMYEVDMANSLIREVEYDLESLYRHYIGQYDKVNPNNDGGALLEYMASNSGERLSSIDVDDEVYSDFVKVSI
jgi:Domain of unknown function (DUF4413)